MKQRKNMILLVAILAVLVLIYFGLNSWNKSEEEKATKEQEEKTIYLVGDDELTAISYTDSSSSMNFVMEDGTWYYEADKEIPMSQEAVGSIENLIVNLTAERELSDPDELEDYGLTEPLYTVCYTAEGVENAIYIGNMTGDNYYVTVNDAGKVYVCSSELVDGMTFDLSGVVQNDEIPSIGSGNLLKVEVVEDGTTMVYEDEDSLAQLAGGFGVLSLDTCVDYHVTEEALPEYGLDEDSRITAIATYSDPDTEEEETFTIYIGSMVDEENQYIMVKDSILAYQVSADVVENMSVVSEEEVAEE